MRPLWLTDTHAFIIVEPDRSNAPRRPFEYHVGPGSEALILLFPKHRQRSLYLGFVCDGGRRTYGGRRHKGVTRNIKKGENKYKQSQQIISALVAPYPPSLARVGTDLRQIPTKNKEEKKLFSSLPFPYVTMLIRLVTTIKLKQSLNHSICESWQRIR